MKVVALRWLCEIGLVSQNRTRMSTKIKLCLIFFIDGNDSKDTTRSFPILSIMACVKYLEVLTMDPEFHRF